MFYKNDTPRKIFRHPNTSGDIGMELEVEGHNLPAIDDRHWVSVSDGSLRLGGREYITKGPKPINNILAELEYWEERLANSNSTVYLTDRTSVHVHLNQQKNNLFDIAKGLTAYYLLENSLMNYCGPNRKGNLFCTSLSDSPSQIRNYKIVCGKSGSFATDKYSAMNVHALKKFGSVEQRGMRGYYDPAFLTEWAKNLQKIFVSAKEFESPVHVFDHMYGRNYREFCGTFLYGSFVDKLVSFPDWNIDSHKNTVLLGDFLYKHEFKDRPKNVKIPDQRPSLTAYSTAVRSFTPTESQQIMSINNILRDGDNNNTRQWNVEEIVRRVNRDYRQVEEIRETDVEIGPDF